MASIINLIVLMKRYLFIFVMSCLSAGCSRVNVATNEPAVQPDVRLNPPRNASKSPVSLMGVTANGTTTQDSQPGDWTTYTDTAYGFSLNIPAGYVYATSTAERGWSPVLIVYDPENLPIASEPAVTVYVSTITSKEQESPSYLLQQEGIPPAAATVTPTRFAGCLATQIIIENTDGGYPVEDQMFVAHDGLEYSIRYTARDNTTFARIASSFVFLATGC